MRSEITKYCFYQTWSFLHYEWPLTIFPPFPQNGDRRNTSLASAVKKDPSESTVYINADLEVVYPPLPVPGSSRRDFISDDDDEAEFEHLLRGGSVTRVPTYDNGDTDCDEYENDADEREEDLFQRQNVYVPSPAPGKINFFITTLGTIHK